MNDTWKNFRLQEYKIFQPGFQHGFDLSDFKPGGFKKVLKALNIPLLTTAEHGSIGFVVQPTGVVELRTQRQTRQWLDGATVPWL